MSTAARITVIVIIEIIAVLIFLYADSRRKKVKPVNGYVVIIALGVLQIIAYFFLPGDVKEACAQPTPGYSA